MPRIISVFKNADYKECGVYLLESLFFQDVTKFFAGVLTATSAMLQLGMPHLNVISKMDLLSSKFTGRQSPTSSDGSNNNQDDDEDVDEESHHLHRFFYPDSTLLEEQLSEQSRPKFLALNRALVQLIDEYDMVKFIPLNVKKEASLANILMHIENATQYSEGLEPKEPRDLEGDSRLSDVD